MQNAYQEATAALDRSYARSCSNPHVGNNPLVGNLLKTAGIDPNKKLCYEQAEFVMNYINAKNLPGVNASTVTIKVGPYEGTEHTFVVIRYNGIKNAKKVYADPWECLAPDPSLTKFKGDAQVIGGNP